MPGAIKMTATRYRTIRLLLITSALPIALLSSGGGTQAAGWLNHAGKLENLSGHETSLVQQVNHTAAHRAQQRGGGSDAGSSSSGGSGYGTRDRDIGSSNGGDYGRVPQGPESDNGSQGNGGNGYQPLPDNAFRDNPGNGNGYEAQNGGGYADNDDNGGYERFDQPIGGQANNGYDRVTDPLDRPGGALPLQNNQNQPLANLNQYDRVDPNQMQNGGYQNLPLARPPLNRQNAVQGGLNNRVGGYQNLPANAGGDGYQNLPANAGGDGYQPLPANAGGQGQYANDPRARGIQPYYQNVPQNPNGPYQQPGIEIGQYDNAGRLRPQYQQNGPYQNLQLNDGYQNLPANAGGDGYQPLPANAGGDGYQPLPANAGGDGYQPLPANAGGDGYQPLQPLNANGQGQYAGDPRARGIQPYYQNAPQNPNAPYQQPGIEIGQYDNAGRLRPQYQQNGPYQNLQLNDGYQNLPANAGGDGYVGIPPNAIRGDGYQNLPANAGGDGYQQLQLLNQNGGDPRARGIQPYYQAAPQNPNAPYQQPGFEIGQYGNAGQPRPQYQQNGPYQNLQLNNPANNQYDAPPRGGANAGYQDLAIAPQQPGRQGLQRQNAVQGGLNNLVNNNRQYDAPPIAPYQQLQLAPNPNGPSLLVPPRNQNQAAAQQNQYGAPPIVGFQQQQPAPAAGNNGNAYQQLQLAPNPNGQGGG